MHLSPRLLSGRPAPAGILHPSHQGHFDLSAYEPQRDPVGLLPRGGLRGQPQAYGAPLCSALPDSHDQIVDQTLGGVSNVDIDENNGWQIKAIGIVISTCETLPFKFSGRTTDRPR